MACSTAVLDDIEENFCQCPICFEEYKEPKQLPCLHRYCLECLRKLLQTCDTIITCPECRKEFPVPAQGVDGFSTDFYTQKLVEHIAVKKSLEKGDTVQVCYGCSKETQVSVYCDKCNKFLCRDCHDYHATSNLFRDHKAHLININDTKIETILTKRLAKSQTEPLKCFIHQENITQLCCSTCNNMFICITCTYGEHKKHDINDVITFANAEQKRLEEDMELLYKAKENLDKVTSNLSKIKKDISSFAAEKADSLREHYKQELAKTEAKRRLLKRGLAQTHKVDCNDLQSKVQAELQKIRGKLVRTKETKEVKEKPLKSRQTFQEKDFVLVEESNLLRKRFQEALTLLESEEHIKLGEVKKISQHYDGTSKRFDNLVATTSGILQSQCSWTAAQCIPEIRTAIQPLIVDMNKRFPELNKLSHFNFNVTLKPQIDQILLGNVRGYAWNINCITSTMNGSIVTCGSASGTSTHITVVDAEGNTICQKQFKGPRSGTPVWRFCCPLQKNKIVTVSWPDKMGIFNTQDGCYTGKNITEIASSCPELKFQGFWSIARDETKKLIVVTYHKSKTVHVLNYQLKFCYNIELPQLVHWPRGITINRGNLIVCDLAGQSAHAVDLKGNLVYSFSKVDYDGILWKPFNVCTDREGLVWMLFSSGTGDSILVKYYNSEVFQVVQRLDGSAECLTAYETADTSWILVASLDKGIIFKIENVF